MRISPVGLWVLFVTAVVPAAARADEGYVSVPLGELNVAGGQLPADGAFNDRLAPYAVLDGEGEAFVVPANTSRAVLGFPPLRECALVARTPAPGPVSGSLFVPDAKAQRLVPLRYTASSKSKDGRDAFFLGKQWHYEHLLARGVPGGAWFRYQARAARLAVDPNATQPQAQDRPGRFDRPTELEETYALFSGGRALSENLQLDRAMPPRDPRHEAEEVDLARLRDIATQSMDWKSKLDDAAKAAERDPLAKLIPHDQHALLFPTFDAMVALADEADRYGTVALQATEPRSEDAGVRRRYERQLGLSLSGLGRHLGPQAVKSVAVTGSDPYLRVGSDVAILFEPRDDAPALLVLTDATIRRWCGPRWRIADSRRTRVAALLADVQAQHAEKLVRDQVREGESPQVDLYVQDMGQIRVLPAGVHSSTYGSLAFMTPIVELPVEKVSGAEARAYERWRDTYESNWSQFFDPIAVRLSMRPDKTLAADMTVMPLIQYSSYRPLVSVTRDASLPPSAGDPHKEALVHLALAINPKSPTVTLGASFLANILPGDKADLLASLGPAAALYADDDPLWAEVTAAKDPLAAMVERIGRLPLALHVELKDAERMKAYLSGAEQWAQESYPGYSRWEAQEYHGQPYVKITATDKTLAEQPRLKGAALCFVNTGKALVITAREDLLRRAIDRQKQPDANGPQPWLGTSGGLRVQAKAWDVLRQGLSGPYRQAMRRRAWDNLPALNEWKRLYPDQDPLDVHERLWQTRLLDPAGGRYVWNERFRTMESTTFGHPGEPREGPDAPAVMEGLKGAQFGLSFEPDGLRAKASVERKPADR